MGFLVCTSVLVIGREAYNSSLFAFVSCLIVHASSKQVLLLNQDRRPSGGKKMYSAICSTNRVTPGFRIQEDTIASAGHCH